MKWGMGLWENDSVSETPNLPIRAISGTYLRDPIYP